MNRQVYATKLLQQAAAWPPRDLPAHVWPAVDAFLVAPTAATFLRASAAFTRARHDRACSALSNRLAGRHLERARRTVAGLESLDAVTRGALCGSPADSRAAARLHALAHMVTAYQELAGRAQAATLELRRQFALKKGKKPKDRAQA